MLNFDNRQPSDIIKTPKYELKYKTYEKLEVDKLTKISHDN